MLNMPVVTCDTHYVTSDTPYIVLKIFDKFDISVFEWHADVTFRCKLMPTFFIIWCPCDMWHILYRYLLVTCDTPYIDACLYILQILFLRFERNTLSPILVQCQAPGRCWFYKREIWFRGQNKSKLHFPQFWCSSSRKNLPSQAFLASLWWVQVKIVLKDTVWHMTITLPHTVSTSHSVTHDYYTPA